MNRHAWSAGGVRYEVKREGGSVWVSCEPPSDGFEHIAPVLEEMLRLAQEREAELWRCVEVLSAVAASAEDDGMERTAALLRHIKDTLFRGLPVGETLQEIGVRAEKAGA